MRVRESGFQVSDLKLGVSKVDSALRCHQQGLASLRECRSHTNDRMRFRFDAESMFPKWCHHLPTV